MSSNRYPNIHIRSKNELAKHITSQRLPFKSALELINDVLTHFDQYWADYEEKSQPEKEKWVRNASGTNLGRLLKLIDAKVLKPHDKLLPDFIFGGVGGLNHKAAVNHLLGIKRKRVLLKLDVSRFFEQVKYERVYSFFLNKCGCSKKGAKLIADLCCVSYGSKADPKDYKTIARGFSTSARLAVWCNLDTFLKLEQLVIAELRGHDPRIAIYVDDIGITASRVTKEDMMRLYEKARKVIENGNANQRLPLNHQKTKIIYHSGETFDANGLFHGRWGFEHLGLQMNRRTLTLGTKSRLKLLVLTRHFKQSKDSNSALKLSRKSMLHYKKYIER